MQIRTDRVGMLVDSSQHASVAHAALSGEVDRWVETMTDDQLEVPGFGRYPMGSDPQIPFIGIVWCG